MTGEIPDLLPVNDSERIAVLFLGSSGVRRVLRFRENRDARMIMVGNSVTASSELEPLHADTTRATDTAAAAAAYRLRVFQDLLAIKTLQM